MNLDARELGEVHSYGDLARVLRERVAELQITHNTLDEVAGLQSGYSGKLLAPEPIKRLGAMSFSTMLDALGVKLIAFEDLSALEKVRARLVKRERPPLGSIVGSIRKRKLSKEQKWSRRMNRRRREKLGKRKCRAIARLAATQRWAQLNLDRGARPRRVSHSRKSA